MFIKSLYYVLRHLASVTLQSFLCYSAPGTKATHQTWQAHPIVRASQDWKPGHRCYQLHRWNRQDPDHAFKGCPQDHSAYQEDGHTQDHFCW